MRQEVQEGVTPPSDRTLPAMAPEPAFSAPPSYAANPEAAMQEMERLIEQQKVEIERLRARLNADHVAATSGAQPLPPPLSQQAPPAYSTDDENHAADAGPRGAKSAQKEKRSPLIDFNARRAFSEQEVEDMRNAVTFGDGAEDDVPRRSRWATANAARRQTPKTLNRHAAAGSPLADDVRGPHGVHPTESAEGRPTGTALVRATISLWWDTEWRRAKVVSYSKKTGKHRVRLEGSAEKKGSPMALDEWTWELVERAPTKRSAAPFDPTASVLHVPKRVGGDRLPRTPVAAPLTGDPDEDADRAPTSSKGQVRPSRRSVRVADPNAPRIAFSGLLQADLDVLTEIATSLGGVLVGEDSAAQATHLVLGNRGTKGQPGAPKRTVKVLNGILRGAWLISAEWLYRSVEKSAFVPEQDFETRAFSGASIARQLREGGEVISPLNATAVAIAEPVGSDAHARIHDLALSAGATVTSTTRAQVVIGSLCPPSTRSTGRGGARSSRRGAHEDECSFVSAEWLYDSISNMVKMPFESYAVGNAIS